MTPLQRIRASASVLKTFPLPQVVLFPGSAVPLHIFEPRYRDMLRDCLAEDKVLALAQLDEELSDEWGQPRVKPMACAGLVTFSELLPDGRYHILLEGVVRAQLGQEREPGRKAYREFQGKVLEDPPFQGDSEELLRAAVLELCSRLPAELSEALLRAIGRSGGGALADIVASAMVSEPDQRYALLAEEDVGRRIDRVFETVGELLGKLEAPRPKGPVN